MLNDIFKDYEIIKHIPHDSVNLPCFYKELIKNNYSFYKYVYKIADLGITHLFNNISGKTIRFNYSRIFCDVERFKDDDLEIMAKIGQGMLYTNFYDGTPINLDDKYKDIRIKLANKLYDKHHAKLNLAIKNIINSSKKCLLLDLHSYSAEQAKALGFNDPFPDICIGINDDYCDKNILNYIVNKINDFNLTYKINYPYSGSILPNDINNYNYKDKLTSIMLEVNKKIYL